MKNYIFGMLLLSLVYCQQKEQTLIKFYSEGFNGSDTLAGYLNLEGDTIIPAGKYVHCFTDTINTFGMVMEKGTGKIIGIDQNATALFEVFKYDNGPDYVQNGLFRIIKNGKIGYANLDGEIIIEARFDCAYPFEENVAKVSGDCTTITEGDYSMWESDNWYKITVDGKRMEE